MHELSYVTELYKRLHKEQKNITDVYLTVSSSSGIETESFMFYWNSLNQSLLLKTTRLHITKTATTLHCLTCRNQWISQDEDSLLEPCPACHSHKTVQTDQSSVTIEKIIYETDESN